MSRRDDTVPLRHMRDHASEAIELATGRTRDDVEKDRVLSLALTRLVEIIGEAAARVSQMKRRAHPAIPWREIVDTRNRLIHGYDSVDPDVLWSIVTNDLPRLLGQLDEILAERRTE